MFLTRQELQDLTGYQRPAYQVRWLRANGWTFTLGADRRPRVARDHARRQLGAVDLAAAPRLRLPSRNAAPSPS